MQKEKKKVVLNERCHSHTVIPEGFCRGSRCFSNNRFPTTALGKDKTKGTVLKGFTLIELLVVILIIGILAAVALPQYQKAVERSQASGVKPLLKNIYEANLLIKQETGSSFSSFSELPLEIPGTPGSINGYGVSEKRTFQQWQLELHTGAWFMGKMIQVRRMKGPYSGAGLWVFLDKYPFKIHCRSLGGNGTSSMPVYKGNIEDYCQKILGGSPTTWTGWWVDQMYDIP